MAESVTLDRVPTESIYDLAYLLFCNGMENDNFSQDDTIWSIDNTCDYYAPE